MRLTLQITALAAALAGCGGSSKPNTPGPAQVTLAAAGVAPASVNVGSGGQVHFVNNDAAAHQIAGSANCTELNSPSLATGKDFTATLGTGPKTCTFNDGLNPTASAFSGTINVAAPNTPGY